VQIKVIHQDELVVGKVSSYYMALASKVWENLFFEPLTKHEVKDEKPCDGKEDNIEPRLVN
jgi:hypothetical protein